MIGSPVKDRIFKTVILALLVLSVLMQLATSVWVHSKFKTIQSRLSVYPVNQPTKAGLEGKLRRFEEIERKLDRLVRQIDEAIKPLQGRTLTRRSKKAPARLSPTESQKAKYRKSVKSTHVEVVEKVGN